MNGITQRLLLLSLLALSPPAGASNTGDRPYQQSIQQVLQGLARIDALNAQPPASVEGEDRRAAAQRTRAHVEAWQAAMREVALAVDAVPRGAWTSEEQPLVRRALLLQAEAWMFENPEFALAAVDQVLGASPTPDEMHYTVDGLLPEILPRLRDADRAMRRLSVLAAPDPTTEDIRFLLPLADVHALRLETTSARQVALRASSLAGSLLAEAPEDGMLAYRAEQASFRAALLGTQLPLQVPLVGGGALSTRGSIRIIDVAATWCVPCLASLIELDNSASRLKAAGVESHVLMIESSDGWLPDERHRMSSGEKSSGMSREQFALHAEAYRKVLALQAPVSIVTSEAVAPLRAESVPVNLVVDRDGTVRFASRGGMDLVVRAALGLAEAQGGTKGEAVRLAR